MCGRFIVKVDAEAVADHFNAVVDPAAVPSPLDPNYNVAPTNDVYGVVADDGGERHVEVFRWGLVPSWAKDIKIGAKMINARAETVAEKSAFKAVFRKHRCLIPMDGFYEWQAAREGGPTTAAGKPVKQPMFIHRVDGEPLAVAGLWSSWRDRDAGPDAPWVHSCTIITTTANHTMEPVHDRMPVILPAWTWDEWLDPQNHDTEALLRLLVPAPDTLLTMHAVSTDVNSVRNNGPELIAPVDGD